MPTATRRVTRSESSAHAPIATKIGCDWTSVTLAATLVQSRLANHEAKWTASASPDSPAKNRSWRSIARNCWRYRTTATGNSGSVVNSTRYMAATAAGAELSRTRIAPVLIAQMETPRPAYGAIPLPARTAARYSPSGRSVVTDDSVLTSGQWGQRNLLISTATGLPPEMFLDFLDLPFGGLLDGSLVVDFQERNYPVAVNGVVGRSSKPTARASYSPPPRPPTTPSTATG